jgi:hypothetical protein
MLNAKEEIWIKIAATFDREGFFIIPSKIE